MSRRDRALVLALVAWALDLAVVEKDGKLAFMDTRTLRVIDTEATAR